MLEAHVLVNIVCSGINGERRRVSFAQDLNLAVADLYLTGGEIVVDRALWTLPDDTSDAQYILTTHIDIVVNDALHNARMVTKINKGQVFPVLTTVPYPPAHTH